MRNSRCDVAALKTVWVCANFSSAARTSRTVVISPSMLGVGCMPLDVRTNNGSFNCALALESQILTVGMALGIAIIVKRNSDYKFHCIYKVMNSAYSAA